MPYVSWSGVRLEAVPGVLDTRNARVDLSNGERSPYPRRAAPSRVGWALSARHATASAPAAPAAKNRRRLQSLGHLASHTLLHGVSSRVGRKNPPPPTAPQPRCMLRGCNCDSGFL